MWPIELCDYEISLMLIFFPGMFIDMLKIHEMSHPWTYYANGMLPKIDIVDHKYKWLFFVMLYIL